MDEDYYLDVPGVKVCAVCGSWEDLQVHHKNGNHHDDHPKNLEWRCREKCHAKEAHKHFIPKPKEPNRFKGIDFGNEHRKETEFRFR